MPLDELATIVDATVPVARTARGLELDVAGRTFVDLRITGIATLEIDADVDGDLMLTWSMNTGLVLPPMRYQTLPRGPVRLHLDLLQTARWSPSSVPVLALEGSGRLAITALRVRMAPEDPAELSDALDRAAFWAPESIGHTTINVLTPALWSTTRQIALEDVLASTGALSLCVLLAAGWVLRRRLLLGPALAVVALLCTGAAGAYFLLRFVPVARLAFEPDREARIARNYYFTPRVGALAALARAKLPESDRVAVIGARNDWFGPQTLCFNLAPRRCAFRTEAGAELAGISGVGRMRLEEADAIVLYRSTQPLPEGFVQVAALAPDAFVARRR